MPSRRSELSRPWKRSRNSPSPSPSLSPRGGHAADYHAPKNGFGQPDLGGVWTNASLTSLQRPAMFKSLTLTEAEAAALEKRRAAMRAQQVKPSDPTADAPPSANDPGGYNASWTDPGVSLGRIKGQGADVLDRRYAGRAPALLSRGACGLHRGNAQGAEQLG